MPTLCGRQIARLIRVVVSLLSPIRGWSDFLGKPFQNLKALSCGILGFWILTQVASASSQLATIEPTATTKTWLLQGRYEGKFSFCASIFNIDQPLAFLDRERILEVLDGIESAPRNSVDYIHDSGQTNWESFESIKKSITVDLYNQNGVLTFGKIDHGLKDVAFALDRFHHSFTLYENMRVEDLKRLGTLNRWPRLDDYSPKWVVGIGLPWAIYALHSFAHGSFMAPMVILIPPLVYEAFAAFAPWNPENRKIPKGMTAIIDQALRNRISSHEIKDRRSLFVHTSAEARFENYNFPNELAHEFESRGWDRETDQFSLQGDLIYTVDKYGKPVLARFTRIRKIEN